MEFELPIVSAISALLVLIPLPWHLRTRNVCTTSLILWLAVCNILRTTNTIIWIDNVTVKHEIWCDIVARISVGANIGVPASTVCICCRLAHASAPYSTAPKSSEKRQRAMFEIAMCIVLPIALSGLNVLVEPSRFDIAEGFGCGASFHPSIPDLFISHIPAILLSWTALVYSGIALRWLIHRRVQFQQGSQRIQKTPMSSHYIRLVVLAIIQMTLATVMSLFSMMMSIQVGFSPWEEVRKNRRDILIQPKDMMPEAFRAVDKAGWYFVPITSVTVFAYFGFDHRLVLEYENMFALIKRAFSALWTSGMRLFA